MYKLFAFLLFGVITLVGISVISPHDEGNFFRKASSTIFISAILIYIAFVVYVLIDAIFVVKKGVFAKLSKFTGKFKDSSSVVVVSNIFYFGGVLALSLLLFFTVLYFSFFYIFRSSSVLAGGFVSEILKNSSIYSTLTGVGASSEASFAELSRKLDTLEVKLHAQAYKEFFSRNKESYVTYDGDYIYKFFLYNYKKNAVDLENTYDYTFGIYMGSKEDPVNFYAAKNSSGDAFIYVSDQDELIRSAGARRIDVSEFSDLPIVALDLVTSDWSNVYLFYPKSIESGEIWYYQAECVGFFGTRWLGVSLDSYDEDSVVFNVVGKVVEQGESIEATLEVTIDSTGEVTCELVN